jgi:hypothetical protein
MNIPLGPSFETITANLVAPKQPLVPARQEDPAPHEPGDGGGIVEQSATRGFERACIIGAIVVVVFAALLLVL